jgi:hypothetical protein
MWRLPGKAVRLHNLALFFGIMAAFGQDTLAVKEFTYSIRSRAYFNEVIVDEHTVMLQSNERLTTFDIPEGLWKDLTEKTSKLDLNMLKELDAGAYKNASETSLRAKLQIKAGNITYYSPDFVRGSPPREIKPVIELMEKFIDSE